jgi:hypothetical protein
VKRRLVFLHSPITTNQGHIATGAGISGISGKVGKQIALENPKILFSGLSLPGDGAN